MLLCFMPYVTLLERCTYPLMANPLLINPLHNEQNIINNIKITSLNIHQIYSIY